MECLVAMAREAGTAILEVYETDFEVTRKSDASPLTEADLRSHQTITQRLKERYPEVPILSEESAEHTAYEARKSWDLFWLVDPAGRNQGVRQAQRAKFTVNIGLIRGTHPTAGVVYAPAFDLLYYGKVGEGAFKVEGKAGPVPLTANQPRDPSRLVIAGSLSHPTPEMDAFVAEQRRKYSRVESWPWAAR